MITQTLDRPLDPVSAARARHTAKAFDPARRIPEDQIAQLKTLLQLSPSSTNIQPWHFILASTEAGKARVAKGAEGRYAFNRQNILDASHVFVFASRLAAEEDYLRHVLAQEERDGRFASDPDTHKPAMHGGRSMFLNLHEQDYKDAQHWMDKQVYLNLLANALKFTRPCKRAEIQIGFKPINGGGAYFVRDNGIGLDTTNPASIFNSFHRLKNARPFEGSGIGLSLVKRIVERHDGRVWAEGEAGRGAAIYFVLNDTPHAGRIVKS